LVYRSAHCIKPAKNTFLPAIIARLRPISPLSDASQRPHNRTKGNPAVLESVEHNVFNHKNFAEKINLIVLLSAYFKNLLVHLLVMVF
jgi:hypothetical protein